MDTLLYEIFGVSPEEKRVKKYNLAGYSKDDISIKAKDGFITILAENEEFGKTRYVASIPRNSDLKSIKAKVKDGVLTIEIPEKDKVGFDVKIE